MNGPRRFRKILIANRGEIADGRDDCKPFVWGCRGVNEGDSALKRRFCAAEADDDAEED